MPHPLTEWKRQFLEMRGFTRPSGNPLYSYKMLINEYEQLELLLQQCIAANKNKASLNQIANQATSFPALFVLYAAQWWQRRYDGAGWCWEPIMLALGCTASDWDQSQRSICVENGLRDWNLHMRQTQGLRYLGAVAFQGGLPMKLLASARGGIGRLLGRVLDLAGAGDVSVNDVQEWVRSLAIDLPQAYRRSEIYSLLAEMILCVLHLKDGAKLAAAEGAIATLDRYDRNWRHRFPVPVDDEHAQGLIDQLMRDAAKVQLIREVQKIVVERRVESLDNGRWQLRSDIIFPQVMEARHLANLFGANENELPRLLTLRFTLGGHEASRPLRKLAGHERYRLERKTVSVLHTAAAAEHAVALVTADGKRWQGTLSGGGTLSSELPWILEPIADATHTFRLVFQGSGGLSSITALLCIPANWTARSEAGSGAAAPICCVVGSLAEFSRAVWEISDTVRIEDPDGSYFRVKCGQVAAMQENLTWHGKRMWQQFERPEAAFCGVPALYLQSDDGQERLVQGPLAWRVRGGRRGLSAAGMFGPVEALWPAEGETRWRSRIVLLPENASFTIEPGESPNCGALRFSNWRLLGVDTESADVALKAQPITNDFLVQVEYQGEGSPPEWCELRMVWSGNPNEARLRLPFPAKGVRAFDAQAKLLADGALLASGALLGVRLVGFFGHAYQAQLDLALHSGSSVKALAVTRHTHIIHVAAGNSRMELRLIDYAQEINRMLADADTLDSMVQVRLKVGNSIAMTLRIARYACELVKSVSPSRVQLPPDVLIQMSVEQISAMQVAMLRLDAPRDEPITLLPQLTEDVPTGSWRLPTSDLSPGPWLIYPCAGSPLQFRTMLWPVFGGAAVSPEFGEIQGLAAALRLPQEISRLIAIDESLHVLAKNYDHADWTLVELLAKELAHLPLATLDLWRGFARSSKAMAALVLRMGDLPDGFVARFPAELPMMWEAVFFSDWYGAMQALREQARSWFGENKCEGVYRSHLNRRVEDITTANPSLRVMLEVAKGEALGMRSDDVGRHIASGEAFEKIHQTSLFGGQDCHLQRLLRVHQEAEWPGGFKNMLATARRDNCKPYLSPEHHGFHDAVINLPVLLAYCVASDTRWCMNPDELREMRAVQAFDGDWFATAFDLTVSRCLATRKIPISYAISRILSDGTKVFQRNAASAG